MQEEVLKQKVAVLEDKLSLLEKVDIKKFKEDINYRMVIYPFIDEMIKGFLEYYKDFSEKPLLILKQMLENLLNDEVKVVREVTKIFLDRVLDDIEIIKKFKTEKDKREKRILKSILISRKFIKE